MNDQEKADRAAKAARRAARDEAGEAGRALDLVPAELGSSCETWVDRAISDTRCGAPAVVCDLAGPADPCDGPRFFCSACRPDR